MFHEPWSLPQPGLPFSLHPTKILHRLKVNDRRRAFPLLQVNEQTPCSGIVTSKCGRCWTGNVSLHPHLLMSKHLNLPKETRWLCPGPLPDLMSRTQVTSLIPTLWLQFPEASFCLWVSQSQGCSSRLPRGSSSRLGAQPSTQWGEELGPQGFHTAN